MGPESYSAPSTPPLPRWALTDLSATQRSVQTDTKSLSSGRAFVVSKKPLKPLSKRPRSPRHRRFTKPTPVRRIVAPVPQPLGCAPLAPQLPNGFEVPGPELRKSALGGSSGAPFLLQRVLRFSEAWFEPIAEPRLDDWLGKHRELMQSFEAFRSAWEEQRDFIGPNDTRRVMHLMALGPEEPSPKVMQVLQEACAAFFSPLRVAVIRNRPEKKDITPLRCASPEGRQAEHPAPQPLASEDVLKRLAAGLRSDSLLTCALTLSPLSSDGKRSFGASDWSRRVGVFSLASILEEPLCPLVMERTAKFLLHQVTHMFGLLHCCYFRCLMNGAAHQEEADGRPPYLCGVCLKKLQLVTSMDPLMRYMHLARFWAWAGSPQIALWYETRVRVVRSTFSTSQVHLPPTPRLRPPSKDKRSTGPSEDTVHSEAGSTSRAWWRQAPKEDEARSEDETLLKVSPGSSP